MIKNKKYTSNRLRGLLSRKRLLVILAVLLVGFGAFALTRDNDKTDTKSPSDTTINTQPATEAEKSEAERAKERIAESEQSTTTPGQKKTVKPVITDTSNNSIKAYVSGIFEDSGSCTATFTKGGTSLTKTSSGFKNVSYTQCEPIKYGDSSLSSGKWSVTIKYSSATAEGVSDASTVDVQ
ncbi:MAG TPA: hypothetical protein VJY84_00660 [Candidatus Saccharimonadales bacterium]|nr:hypothetical protein [Candidatus Saccharimonadales bacterium]